MLVAYGWRITIGALVLCCGASILGLTQLQLNSHYSAYFDSDDELLIAHQEISALYSRSDSVFVVLESNRSFLDPDLYFLLEDLSAELTSQPFVRSVVSISELGLIGEIESHMGDLVPSHDQLVNNSSAIGLLLSDDERIAGVEVQVALDDRSATAVLDVMSQIRETVTVALKDTSINAHYTGTLALNEAYTQVVRQDLARILPLLFSAIYLVVAVFLGSWRAAIVMIPIGLISVIVAIGLTGLLQLELAAINAFVPVIIVSISVASCVHVALVFLRQSAGGSKGIDAAAESVRQNFLPMSLATLTTALGFMGLAFSPSPPIRTVGYSVAAGIVVAYMLCMTLLPRLLVWINPTGGRVFPSAPLLTKIAEAVDRRRIIIVILSCAMALPAGWLVSRSQIDDNVLDYFAESHPFNRDTRLVEGRLSGISEVIYSVESRRSFGIFRADTIESIARFDQWLTKQPEIRRTISIASTPNIVEAIADGRLQERLDFYRDRFNESEELSPILSRAISSDYASSAVTAYFRKLDSGEMLEFDRRVQNWASDNLSGYLVRSAGPTLMFASLGERNIRSMLIAFSLALIVAAVAFGIALRSWRAVCVGVLCNGLPVLLVFSVWALAVGQINIGAAVVLGMVLGILLDDTIYLLISHRRAQLAKDEDPVSSALVNIGPALIITTTALVAGLILGVVSEFGPIWNMSVLSASIIATALIADLTLLPALLHFRSPDRVPA